MCNKINNKIISEQNKRAAVSKELEDEKIKLAFYDDTIIPLLWNLKDKKVLDYGGGPWVLSLALKRSGADSYAYDISKDFRDQAAKKIGTNNVYERVELIPPNYFDFMICNLVLCIVDEIEVKKIMSNIKKSLNKNGFAYVGFCNPLLLDVEESNLDFRPAPQHKYDQNHSYMKTKKEWNYQIIENHRPIEWYKKIYKDLGLVLEDTLFTPEYELNGRNIKDFIIFKLRK